MNDIVKYISAFALVTAICGCSVKEEDLLSPKVYFENKEVKVEVDDITTLDCDIQARLSSKYNGIVDISYEIAGQEEVDNYNLKNGTDYAGFDMNNIAFENVTSKIEGNSIYATKATLKLNNLNEVKEGESFVLPVRIKSSSIPVLDGGDIQYFLVNKPIKILNVWRLTSHAIKVPVSSDKIFTSVTYEALLKIASFGSNNTVMGTEGLLLLRIGDSALPGGARDLLEIAGRKNFHATQKFVTGKWYHVAFTYDQPSGKAILYINGAKAAESSWDTPNFDLSSDGGGFFIGKVAGFMWGERPFNGNMAEVRLWNVARTENQIARNMLSVDPATEGLAAYYKLNGSDYKEAADGTKYIEDASGHGMHGTPIGYSFGFIELDNPVSVK